MQSESRAPAARLQMRINRICGTLSGIAMLAMMIAGAADVIATNLDIFGLASRPIPGVHEFIGAMMVFSVFLAVSLAQARRAHIQVDLFTRMMPSPAQKALAMVQHALGALVFALIAWFGWKTTAHAISVGEFSAGLFDFPLWPSRAALAFGASLVAVQCLLDMVSVASPRYLTTDDTTTDISAAH